MPGYPCPRTLNIGNQQLTPNQTMQPTASLRTAQFWMIIRANPGYLRIRTIRSRSDKRVASRPSCPILEFQTSRRINQRALRCAHPRMRRQQSPTKFTLLGFKNSRWNIAAHQHATQNWK
jgi:hypothetical protein